MTEVSMESVQTTENWSILWYCYSTSDNIYKWSEICLWYSSLQLYIKAVQFTMATTWKQPKGPRCAKPLQPCICRTIHNVNTCKQPSGSLREGREGRAGKQTMVCWLCGMLLCHWTEWNPTICNKTLPTREHCTHWSKPNPKWQISNVLSDTRQASCKMQNR